MRIGSVCSGAGIHLHGLSDVVKTWAIEYDPKIADIYRMNHGDNVYVARVQDIDPQSLKDIDCLITTPSCKNASLAKGANKGETPEDLAVGLAIASIIKAKLPRIFLLENVWQYRQFEAFKTIERTLSELGYHFQFHRLNLADFGIGQARYRLYGVAVHNKQLKPLAIPNIPKIGWYDALSDLVPTLPESKLANWQLKKFPELANLDSIGLLKRAGGGRSSDRIYLPEEPCYTVRALGSGSSRHSVTGNIVVDGRCYTLSPRACLRLFGDKETADSIKLPQGKALAMECVGNAASWVLFKALIDHAV